MPCLDVALHPVLLPLGDQGADLGGGVRGIAHGEPAHHPHQRVDGFVITAARSENPGLGNARLAVVHQRGHFQPTNSGSEVGVLQDDRGGLAAEFEAAALELLPADGPDPPPGGGGAGERDLVDAGMGNQVFACLSPGGHDIDDAGWQFRLLDQFGQEVRVERCLRSWLEDDRAAGDQSGGNLGHRGELRHVPRHDRGHDADRLAAHGNRPEQPRAIIFPGEGLPEVREITEHHLRLRRLGQLRECDGRAHLFCDQLSHLAQPPGIEVSQPAHPGGAVRRGHPRPRAIVECVTSGRHGAVHVGRGAVGNAADDLLGVRRDDVERGGTGWCDPLAADVEAVMTAHRDLLVADGGAHAASRNTFYSGLFRSAGQHPVQTLRRTSRCEQVLILGRWARAAT